MQELKVGTLLPGARPVGHGVNGALRGFALIDDEEMPVIAKRLSDRELLCEILCSQLGRGLDLPIPEPILLFDEDKQPMFGSKDIGYPNLLHFFNIDSEKNVVLDKLKKWVHLQSASFFDELIFNADRHPGNLLFDGSDFHLIDHGLTMHEFMPVDTTPDKWENQLFSLAIGLCKNDLDKNQISNNGCFWTDKLIQKDVIKNTTTALNGDKNIIDSLSAFLLARQNLLKSMIKMRVGSAQQDFVNA
ncbi:phosphatidylinositol 4-kinase [Enterobacter roggenkampii]|uniref:phosphatidylinositol 4-kinase n=1 Tax=Enterobacter roggenkampii TaxID=1812935 RepID=UPI00207638F9|nr:phosphatidylinositol 4-kinase [Enterobacter roggenkampii]MCM7825543.1 phosphatidylinositol 4-kinase [Enterobacter roggenkampii]